MPRRVAIGAQGFASIRERGAFLVDKTGFVRDWWQSMDDVTLVCRPRRFGKTLNLSMTECFFSTRYAGRSDLFEGLEVWGDDDMRAEQGAWPVIFLSFASLKPPTFRGLRDGVARLVANVYQDLLPENGLLDPTEAALVAAITHLDASDADLSLSLNQLCRILHRLTGRKAIVLLDEYDTPLQEAWLRGYWQEASDFMRGLLNATFKTNPCLERGLLTGITRVAHESIFSDLNNLNVVSTTSEEYATAFGFTQGEVDAALEEFDRIDAREAVRAWYDGFTFGQERDIYNPWSITNYLSKGKLAPYWANTSGNGIVSRLVGTSDSQFKSDFETLLSGGSVEEEVNFQTTFPDLERDPASLWGLLVAGGYLKVERTNELEDFAELSVTNRETMLVFDQMVRRWFSPVRVPYNGFVRALLSGDLNAMNAYLNDVALDTFSTFDTGRRPSGTEPERFYHGFVLGLLVELRGRYVVRSNRESGFGRYDVALEPCDTANDDGYILEFKVRDPSREATLEDSVQSALAQIRERNYAADLVARGVPAERIHAYGLAFEGKHVLVG